MRCPSQKPIHRDAKRAGSIERWGNLAVKPSFPRPRPLPRPEGLENNNYFSEFNQKSGLELATDALRSILNS